MPLKQHLSVVRLVEKRPDARGSARKFLFTIKYFSIFLRPQPRVRGPPQHESRQIFEVTCCGLQMPLKQHLSVVRLVGKRPSDTAPLRGRAGASPLHPVENGENSPLNCNLPPPPISTKHCSLIFPHKNAIIGNVRAAILDLPLSIPPLAGVGTSPLLL